MSFQRIIKKISCGSRQCSVRTLWLMVPVMLLITCKRQPAERAPVRGVTADTAMVVSARVEASRAGIAVLKEGGNAFDAMIATDLVLSVVYPYAGNIGGGGFMVYRTAEGETGALDYREKAPRRASRDMYLDSTGQIIPEASTLGALSVGVPGTVAGLFAVHRKFGSLPFERLIAPAIELAEGGFVISGKQAARLNRFREMFRRANHDTILFDKEWKAGDTCRNPAYAATLKRIRDHGREEFYGGETGMEMIRRIRSLGGIIDKEDLEAYEVIWRKPVSFDFRGYRIYSMSLPSSGGICMAQILKSIEDFPLDSLPHNRTRYIQLLTEAERRAYADRAYYLGDADYVEVPVEELIDVGYLRERMRDFDWNKAGDSRAVSHGEIQITESTETTHYSIVDGYGNAVAVTTTLNGAYGSKVFVPGGGFFLNNEMDDFSIKPGFPNSYGLVGAEANAIAPGKRMLSSMSPTIVTKDGQVLMVLGSPGGSTIITSVLQNILNVTVFGMGMQESVGRPRFHHQWLPDHIMLEPGGFDSGVKDSLRALGYTIVEKNSVVIGKVDAILRKDGHWEGGADPRGEDTAVGY